MDTWEGDIGEVLEGEDEGDFRGDLGIWSRGKEHPEMGQ
jgi:hypothetical protein